MFVAVVVRKGIRRFRKFIFRSVLSQHQMSSAKILPKHHELLSMLTILSPIKCDMESLSETAWDIVLSGTGLSQSLLALYVHNILIIS